MDDRDARERVGRLESLLEEVEALPDPRAREVAGDAVATLVELYGEGLARLLARVPAAEIEAVVGDELLGHLLLVHGLHPMPMEARVEQALDEVRPYLRSHGGGVELESVDAEGVVRLALRGSCSGCPSSRVTLEHAVEEAILRAAPDVAGIEARDADARPAEAPAFAGCELPVVGAAAVELPMVPGGSR